ncbi:nucleotide exchange factor GrpE [Viscerimonas tarda]
MSKEKDFVPEEDINNEELTNEQPVNDEQPDDNANLSVSEEDWKEKYDELNNSYLRLHAEFDNYRKRTLKEKTDLLKTAAENVMVGILPVVDDFERALGTISEAKELTAVKEGVDLIYNKFADFLGKNGVKKMDVIGKAFDVDKHEALTTIPAENEASKDKIVDVIQQGYELGDKVIRYPKVIVAK